MVNSAYNFLRCTKNSTCMNNFQIFPVFCLQNDLRHQTDVRCQKISGKSDHVAVGIQLLNQICQTVRFCVIYTYCDILIKNILLSNFSRQHLWSRWSFLSYHTACLDGIGIYTHNTNAYREGPQFSFCQVERLSKMNLMRISIAWSSKWSSLNNKRGSK